MSSLLKANWDRRADGQADRRAQVSIGMHAHPTSKYRDACASKKRGNCHIINVKIENVFVRC
jgi:hypothetical protein